MPRPFCHRRIAGRPAAPIFKPIGIPMLELEEVIVTLDEFEAIRLADLDGLYQEQAAEQMNVSRNVQPDHRGGAPEAGGRARAWEGVAYRRRIGAGGRPSVLPPARCDHPVNRGKVA